MQGTPTGFWAKLERGQGGEVVAWHPLIDHCADVMAVFEALVALPTIRRRLACLAGLQDLDELIITRLSVLVALHDLGKANLGFQAKGRPELGETAGHVGEGIALLLEGPEPFRRALAFETLAEWGEAVEGLLMSAICHHGRPVGDQTSFQRTRWNPRLGLDPCAELTALIQRLRSWLPRAFQDGGEVLPTSNAFAHAFAGLVMLADWIGSDRRPSLFPFSDDPAQDRLPFARARARLAVENIGIDVEPARRALGAMSRSVFSLIAPGLAPRAGQRAMLEAPIPAAPSVAVLEAETGAGKTEAALAWFVRLFAAGEVDGMMFALPTRTAATQIFRRVRAAIVSTFPNGSVRPPVVLAVPGYLRVDDAEGQTLPGFEVLWPDAHGERERHRGWSAENPKRFLAGPIVVGTIDQVLLSGLMASHAHLRAAALLRHLIVVDEVHASDDYMTRVLRSVLEHHRAAGGHALLLSATLGGEARAQLLSAARPDQATAEAAPYPLLSIADREGLTEVAIEHDARARSVEVSGKSLMEDANGVAAIALDAAKRGAKVIVLRNTVAGCIETQQAVETLAGDSEVLFRCGGVVAPHHSRFARDDRMALDAALELRLGKERAGSGCIVVATQTVQQSLDLDADLLVTDLCPIDVMLQRIGRLHRHERTRPLGFERARVVVLTPSERDLGCVIQDDGTARWHHGIGTVYEDLRVLEGTWHLIESEPSWSIPAMNRHLVEQALHSDLLTRFGSAGEARWRAHSDRVIGRRMGDSRLADLNLVDWSQPYWSAPFPDDRRIPSRLGERDRRVKFQAAPPGPFGNLVRELNVKATWAAGVPAEIFEATDVEPLAEGFAFRYGPRSFVYDRYGIRPSRAPSARPRLREEDDDET